MRTKFVFVFDIIYESGKCSHNFFRRFIMKIKNPDAKKENFIVAVSSVVLVVLLLIVFGLSGIENFFSQPIAWKEPDYITITAANYVPDSYIENCGKLNFFITNESRNNISSYKFLVNLYGEEVVIYCSKNLEPYSVTDFSIGIASDEVKYKSLDSNVVSKENFEKIKNIKCGDVEFKTSYLLTTDGKYLINNNGMQRILAIFVPSLVLGFVGFLEIIKTKWLRMFFKFCGMPVVAVFSIFMICGYLVNSDLAPQVTSNTNANFAKQRYREASNKKRGAVARGDKNAEALAQKEMDKAMADMMRENGSVSAESAQKFKNAASNYAGARMSGTNDTLASATHNRETVFADMISPNTDANRKFKEASNAKRGAHSKNLEASAQQKMDDALSDMLSGK